MMEDFKMLSEDETVKLLAEKERTQKCQLLFKELCISQFQLRPAPPRADPRALAFFLPWMANSRG